MKLLGKEPDISVVAEAETGLAGIDEIEEQKPDVILMDKNNPFTEGLEYHQHDCLQVPGYQDHCCVPAIRKLHDSQQMPDFCLLLHV